MADDFVEDFGITHTLLWDGSFQSWAQLGVSLQPSAKLYAADGTLMREWLGPFDEDEVLELIAGNVVTPAVSERATVDRFCRFTDRFARAQRDAAGYLGADERGRQRILDDLRYAANAMAQTAPSTLAEPASALAAAVRADSQALLDAGIGDEPAAAPGRGDTVAATNAAIAGVQDIAAQTCGVTLEPEVTHDG
jgi:hypothetical protein